MFGDAFIAAAVCLDAGMDATMTVTGDTVDATAAAVVAVTGAVVAVAVAVVVTAPSNTNSTIIVLVAYK